MVNPTLLRCDLGVFCASIIIVIAALLVPATATTAEPKRILILGDSLSAAYGMPSAKSWVSLLAKKLASENSAFQVINASISGETTDGGLRRLPTLLKQHKPKIIIVELGGNDGLRGFPLKVIKTNLTKITQLAQNANATTLIASMKIPPNYGQQYTQGFHNIYQHVAENTGAIYIDFILEDFATDPSYMMADRLHPTAKAQPLILNTVWQSLAPYLSPIQ